MIITDKEAVTGTLNDLLNKECYIAVDRKDIQKLFGVVPELRMIRVTADSVEDLVPELKQDFESVGGVPDKLFAAYVSMDLKMSDLQLLSKITEPATQFKHTIIFGRNPLWAVVLYFFFE